MQWCRPAFVLTRGISAVLKHSPGRLVAYSCTHQRYQCRTHALTRQISAVLMHPDVGELSEAGRPNVGFVCAVFVHSHHSTVEDEDINTSQCCGRRRHSHITVLWKMKTFTHHSAVEDEDINTSQCCGRLKY